MYKDTCGPKTLANHHENQGKPKQHTHRNQKRPVNPPARFAFRHKQNSEATKNGAGPNKSTKHIPICLRYSDLSHRIILKNMQTNYQCGSARNIVHDRPECLTWEQIRESSVAGRLKWQNRGRQYGRLVNIALSHRCCSSCIVQRTQVSLFQSIYTTARDCDLFPPLGGEENTDGPQDMPDGVSPRRNRHIAKGPRP